MANAGQVAPAFHDSFRANPRSIRSSAMLVPARAYINANSVVKNAIIAVPPVLSTVVDGGIIRFGVYRSMRHNAIHQSAH